MPRRKFPVGLKIQDKKGPGKLLKTLEKLQKYSFRGYIRITVDEELEGYITLKDGSPKNALLYTPSDMELSGEDALSKMKDMDDMENLYLEVHTKVDIDELVEEVGGRLGETTMISKTSEDELQDRVYEETKSLQEEVSEEDEKISPVSKKIDKKIEREGREEKEVEVYDMIIKERNGKKIEGGKFPEKYSFDNFVVGENNKLAFVACKEVSRREDGRFNPLVLTSKAGLGKTHLLKAIGHNIESDPQDINVVYSTTENCTTDIIRSLKGELSEDTRDKYYGADVLLLDDIQFLAGRGKHQEIIFYLLNHLVTDGSQVVLSSDRSPEEIPDLRERLVSRFKSGLVVRIEPPSYTTRLKIVQNKLEQHEMDVPDEVKEYLAKHITKNVREIEGAINRLLAFSSLLDQEITLDSVRSSFRKHQHQEHGTSEIELNKRLIGGASYVIEEERPDMGFQILEDISQKDGGVYIISRMNPKRITSEYSLNMAELYWLTDRESQDLNTVRPNLESITFRLEEIIEEGKVIMLDGVEYLISHTGFDATVQFLRHMIDMVSETDTIFLITISPSALKDREISILEREMEVLEIQE